MVDDLLKDDVFVRFYEKIQPDTIERDRYIVYVSKGCGDPTYLMCDNKNFINIIDKFKAALAPAGACSQLSHRFYVCGVYTMIGDMYFSDGIGNARNLWNDLVRAGFRKTDVKMKPTQANLDLMEKYGDMVIASL